MKSLRILILHQPVSSDSPVDELDVLDEVRAIRAALVKLGHRPTVLPLPTCLEVARQMLRRARPDCVFNLVETILGHGSLAATATALLDTEGIAYTGAGTAGMALTTDKVATKRALEWAGIPTPAWVTLHEHRGFRPGRYVIKPIAEDASVGLDEGSLVRVHTLEECRRELARRRRRLGRPVFAERFIEGREFNISVLGDREALRVLPIAEIVFDGFAERGKPTLVGYLAKWDKDSFEYKHTIRSFDTAPTDRSLYRRLAKVALTACRVLGCSGYARVDVRTDRLLCPHVLEVNANPCLAPDAGFVAAAAQAKMDYPAVVAELLRVACLSR